VYAVSSDTSSPYWRQDDYRYRMERSNNMPKEYVPQKRWYKKIVYVLTVGGKPVDFHRDEYWPIGKLIKALRLRITVH